MEVEKSKHLTKRPWTVTLLAILLLVEGVGLIYLGGFNINKIALLSNSFLYIFASNIPVILRSAGFFALGLLGVLASIGFFRIWRYAWISAMLLQGLCMIIALDSYFRDKPFYVFILMIYSITMVIYLNYSEVILTFRTKYPAEI